MKLIPDRCQADKYFDDHFGCSCDVKSECRQYRHQCAIPNPILTRINNFGMQKWSAKTIFFFVWRFLSPLIHFTAC